MDSRFYFDKIGSGLTDSDINGAINNFFEDLGYTPKRILLLPPDITRLHSAGGVIASIIYHKMKSVCDVMLMPALGTHEPMTAKERSSFFDNMTSS